MMPFTLSHPAAVLPVHSKFKNWIPLSALVIGSLMPDAAYYLPMPEHFKQTSHTLLGTFSSSLPFSILAILVFYWIAEATVFTLPSPHREALQPRLKPPPSSIQQVMLVLVGIVIGAWSHVLWDSCTHNTGWIVMHTPLLQIRIFPRFPIYKGLQYLSTVVAIWILLYVYEKWLASLGLRLWVWRKPGWRFYLWCGVIGACLVAAVIESHMISAIASHSFLRNQHFVLVLITSFVRNMLIAIVGVSISVRVWFGVRSV